MSLRNKQNVPIYIIQNNNRWSIIADLPTRVLGDAFISLKYSSRHNSNNNHNTILSERKFYIMYRYTGNDN